MKVEEITKTKVREVKNTFDNIARHMDEHVSDTDVSDCDEFRAIVFMNLLNDVLGPVGAMNHLVNEMTDEDIETMCCKDGQTVRDAVNAAKHNLVASMLHDLFENIMPHRSEPKHDTEDIFSQIDQLFK